MNTGAVTALTLKPEQRHTLRLRRRAQLRGRLGKQHAARLYGNDPNPGRGRALGVGDVKFTGQVTPDIKKVVYKIDLKRVINRKLVMGIADGSVSVDGETIYTASDLRVGLFQNTEDM